MSEPPLTAGETAGADQLSATAREDIARLARSVRAGDAQVGEAQNLANFIAYLRLTHTPSYLAALVVAAVRQIPDGSS